MANTNCSLNFKSLDALRGILSTYIAAGHCAWLLWAPVGTFPVVIRRLLSLPATAAMIFFMLSGFFIHLRVSRQIADHRTFQFNPADYLKHRGYRLLPPYLLALILTVSVDALGTHCFPTLYRLETPDPFINARFSHHEFSLASIAPALLMLPSSLGKSFGSNAALWFIAFQTIYYLLYPFWLILRRRGGTVAYASGTALAITAYYCLPPCFIKNVLTFYPLWLCGALLAEVVSHTTLPRWTRVAGCVFSPISLVLIQTCNLRFSVCACLLLSASTIVAVITLSEKICTYRIHRFFEALGIASYSTYLCHFPVVVFISAWAFEVFGKPPQGHWLMLGGLLMTLSLCYLCFVLCERHVAHPRLFPHK